MDIFNLYLSVPVTYCREAYSLEKQLGDQGYGVCNPCRIIIPDLPKEKLPSYIAVECYRLIEISNAIILFSDYYGRDCSAEIGYAVGRKKPIFPFSAKGIDSSNLEQDWMIRPMLQPLSKSFNELLNNLVNVYESLEEKYGQQS
jgi:nucleoside 2-deoxyribosyltransferase